MVPLLSTLNDIFHTTGISGHYLQGALFWTWVQRVRHWQRPVYVSHTYVVTTTGENRLGKLDIGMVVYQLDINKVVLNFWKYSTEG